MSNFRLRICSNPHPSTEPLLHLPVGNNLAFVLAKNIAYRPHHTNPCPTSSSLSPSESRIIVPGKLFNTLFLRCLRAPTAPSNNHCRPLLTDEFGSVDFFQLPTDRGRWWVARATEKLTEIHPVIIIMIMLGNRMCRHFNHHHHPPLLLFNSRGRVWVQSFIPVSSSSSPWPSSRFTCLLARKFPTISGAPRHIRSATIPTPPQAPPKGQATGKRVIESKRFEGLS